MSINSREAEVGPGCSCIDWLSEGSANQALPPLSQRSLLDGTSVPGQ